MSTLPGNTPFERLVRNLRLGGGWYALYPPPRAFHAFHDDGFTAAIRHSNGDPIPAQLALHFDIPAAVRSSFCQATERPLAIDRDRAQAYCDRLVREIGLVGSLFDRDRDVVQVGLAPGMARWMQCSQVAELMESLGRYFHVNHVAGIDLAMTLDLDDLAQQPLRDWAALGFNRVGINLAAISGAGTAEASRPGELTRLLGQARDAGFANLRMELPYATAGQSDLAFMTLVEAVVASGPDRIGMRHCPSLESDSERRAPYERHARMLLAGADALEAAGYLHVGVDVFARPGDPLVAAQDSGRLYRDALGFGAHGATHLVGFGVGAISQLGGCYAQNPLDQSGWEARIDYGHRAADRGVELGDDDQLRAALLQDILCHGRIDIEQLETHHRIDFRDYFADALGRLRPLFEDGSLTWGQQEIHFDRPARLASQAIASQFDPLLATGAGSTASI